MKKLFLLIITTLLFGCLSPKKANDSACLDCPFKIRYADTINAVESDIKFSFDSVLTDSRCCTNCTCKWEGETTLLFTFTKNNIVSAVILSSHLDYPQYPNDTVVNNTHIKLVNVEPYPDSVYIDKADYVAEMLMNNL